MALFSKAQEIKSTGGSTLPAKSITVDPAEFPAIAEALEQAYPLALNENAIRKSQTAPTGERIVVFAAKVQSTPERKCPPGSVTFYYNGKVTLIGSMAFFAWPLVKEPVLEGVAPPFALS